MKTKIVYLSIMSVMTAYPAFASPNSTSCHEGTAGQVGYVEISISSSKAITQSEEVGTELEIVTKKIVRLGRNSITTITTELRGTVIADTRPMPQPDPVTMIELRGEDEIGQPTRIGLLLVRPRLSEMASMELNPLNGPGQNLKCE